MTIIERALEMIADDCHVGLGSGRAARAFVAALGARVRTSGLKVVGVPTSEETAALARAAGVPLRSLAEVGTLDLAVDGADEVDPRLNLIKGYGHALVREKIVAASSRRLVILVGAEKLVSQLGARGRLPIEVVPFALPLCERRLDALGLTPTPYRQGDALFVTDNGNHILDCHIGPIDDAARLETDLRAIPGVVGTGLFLDMADTVLVGDPENWQLHSERRRPAATPTGER